MWNRDSAVPRVGWARLRYLMPPQTNSNVAGHQEPLATGSRAYGDLGKAGGRIASMEFGKNTPGVSLASLGESTTDTEYYSPVPEGYVRGQHKYVVVLGTVMSGLGKGIFSSSVAKMLKEKGLVVAPIKMEEIGRASCRERE